MEQNQENNINITTDINEESDTDTIKYDENDENDSDTSESESDTDTNELNCYGKEYIKQEIYVADFHQTKWLVLSSTCFLFSSAFAYYNKLYVHFLLTLCLSFSSANYWRKATYSLRRHVYLTTHCITFTIFLFDSLFYVKPITKIFVPLYLILFTIKHYYSACKAYKDNNKYWYEHYILFQLGIVLDQIIVLSHIVKYNEGLLVQ
jgi:hypothetical protein